jgi:uncharacterized coiled-coil protein SlyX
MISVRVSEEEHLALRRLCAATGARSISDLTRDAMRALVNRAIQTQGVETNMDEFRAQMRTLDEKIEHLSSEIAAFRANSKR